MLDFIRKKLWLIILIFILIFVYYRIDQSEELDDRSFYLTVFWLFITGLLIVFLNAIIAGILDKYFNWKKYALARFLLQILLGTVFSLVCLNISYMFLKSQFTDTAPDSDQLILMNIYGAALIIPIYALRFGIKFLKEWKRSELDYETLQKENAKSQMMTLRNHLDPHFLFNNLNILSSLMDSDIATSKTYLDKFAEVYRIILRTEYSDLTTVADELKLIESYVYLLKIRFDNALSFELNISNKAREMAIPPLSIQMLIENAIKHNALSEQKPIHIKVYDNNAEQLIVENNIQIKKYLNSNREGTGIENIKKRYAFFTDETVIIEKSNAFFKLRLPLIEIEDL